MPGEERLSKCAVSSVRVQMPGVSFRGRMNNCGEEESDRSAELWPQLWSATSNLSHSIVLHVYGCRFNFVCSHFIGVWAWFTLFLEGCNGWLNTVGMLLENKHEWAHTDTIATLAVGRTNVHMQINASFAHPLFILENEWIFNRRAGVLFEYLIAQTDTETYICVVHVCVDWLPTAYPHYIVMVIREFKHNFLHWLICSDHWGWIKH